MIHQRLIITPTTLISTKALSVLLLLLVVGSSIPDSAAVSTTAREVEENQGEGKYRKYHHDLYFQNHHHQHDNNDWPPEIEFSIELEEFTVHNNDNHHHEHNENEEEWDDQDEAAAFWQEDYENDINSTSTHHHEVLISRRAKERRLANACIKQEPFATYKAKLHAVLGNAKGMLKTPEKKKKYGQVFKDTYNRFDKRRHKCVEIENVDILDQLYETRPAPRAEAPMYSRNNLRFNPRLYVKHSITGKCRGCRENEIINLIIDDLKGAFAKKKVDIQGIRKNPSLRERRQLLSEQNPVDGDDYEDSSSSPEAEGRMFYGEGSKIPDNVEVITTFDNEMHAPPLSLMLIKALMNTDIFELSCLTWLDFFDYNPRCFVGENTRH